MRHVGADEPALPWIARLAIVELEEPVGAQEIGALAHAGRLLLREDVLRVGQVVVVASPDAGCQVLQTAADDGLRERPHAHAAAEDGAAQPVVGLRVAIRVGAETEEVLAGVVAPAGPAFDEEALVRQLGKANPPFRREVATRGPGYPDIEGAVVVEQIAIAKSEPVREAAAHRHTAELRIEALAIEDEDGAIFEDVEPAFKGVGLMRPGLLRLGRTLRVQGLRSGGGWRPGLCFSGG